MNKIDLEQAIKIKTGGMVYFQQCLDNGVKTAQIIAARVDAEDDVNCLKRAQRIIDGIQEYYEAGCLMRIWTRNHTINEILLHTGNRGYNDLTDRFDEVIYDLASLELCSNFELADIYSEMAAGFNLKVID